MRTLSLRMLSLLGLNIGAWLGAGELSFAVTTDKPDALYQPGEKMVFSIQLLDAGKPVAGRELRWLRRGDDQQEEKGTLTSQVEPVAVTTTLGAPGFVRLTITAHDENGQPCKDANGGNLTFEGGAGVKPEALQTIPEPADFAAFWQAQKKRLSEVPLKAEMKPVATQDPSLLGFDVTIDCAGGKPVAGYFVKPKDAAPKSLPARASFHGYGVSSAVLNEDRTMLTLDINAHGIANGQPEAFYEALRAGELRNYAFSNNDSPETSYFLGMFLRLLRALEFLEAQPEWDGANLIVTGGSQGGLQALVAAGLDERVTFCMANRPWCCDLGGITLGRQRGWRPEYTAALGYFDPANHVKRTKAFVLVDAGLGDYVCPPSGISAMLNNIPSADKRLVTMQGATHGYTPPGCRTAWNDYGACLAQSRRRP
jgi:cephalosporin-C deacetylase-like acetyl esterase